MRSFAFTFMILAAALLAGCEFWPRNLEPLARSISEQLSGEATALLLGGDMVMIEVAGSPQFAASAEDLEALATGIAGQAMDFVDAPLESIVVTLYEGPISDNPEQAREFIFLVSEGRPVLQPAFDPDATGPLTAEELQAALDRVDESYARLGKPREGEDRACLRSEVEQRAREAGDPETLDPANVEFLTPETWHPLDAFGKRLILTQAIVTKALFVCASAEKSAGPP